MVKVHCLISCLCEIVKRRSDVDYRPYYFGIWDSDFDVTEAGELTYFSDRITHDGFLYWYQQLYGMHVTEWWDGSAGKQENLDACLKLVEERPEHRYIIVQLDLSLLPERENKFNQTPFPHYLMISKTENEDEWFVFDPDFRWEGNVSRAQVIDAIVGNPFGGGFYVDAAQVAEPSRETLQRYFQATFRGSDNPLTGAVKDIVLRKARQENGDSLNQLIPALKQLKVLAIRKYAYEHALMYFMLATGYDEAQFDLWCDKIEEVVQGYNAIQFLTTKMAITGKTDHMEALLGHVDRIDRIELEVKGEVERLFQSWCELSRKESLHV